jgi:hypothetical protein
VAVELTHHVRRAILKMLAGLTAVAVAPALLVFSSTGASAADAPVGLGTAGNFSVLAGSTATNTGATVLAQSLGVQPGNTAPGFGPGAVAGEVHLADAAALQAESDLTTAYNDAAGRTPFTNLASELGDTTLIPGIYRIGAAQVTGQLTLNAQGNPQAMFIFQIDSTLSTASNSSVTLINGASPCNVYWQVGGSATLGTGTAFAGNIMALTSITMNTKAALQGRALARTAGVTLDTNVITEPACLAPTTPATPTATTSTDEAMLTATRTKTRTASPTARPTTKPTTRPTTRPTAKPTAYPTARPTARPTGKPKPTAKPTHKPTAKPTHKPTAKPTAKPTHKPTAKPTARPTHKPTAKPTAKPTHKPTAKPTAKPTHKPTAKPTAQPTHKPTANPTAKPTHKPTAKPTARPTGKPKPTAKPRPTTTRTARPTHRPTMRPTVAPTARPTARPTRKPSAHPPADHPTEPNRPNEPGGLPTTGSGLLPILMGTGTALVLLGAALLLLYRRRIRES